MLTKHTKIRVNFVSKYLPQTESLYILLAINVLYIGYIQSCFIIHCCNWYFGGLNFNDFLSYFVINKSCCTPDLSLAFNSNLFLGYVIYRRYFSYICSYQSCNNIRYFRSIFYFSIAVIFLNKKIDGEIIMARVVEVSKMVQSNCYCRRYE